MAIIPLKQKAYVRKSISIGWGEYELSEPVEHKVRVNEKTSVTKNQLGEEAISIAKFYFNKLPNITYADELTYTNENGLIIQGKPIKIEPKRLINGKPTLTLVYL